MGRYYNGDIEGKFWFAVQSSDAADRFGVTGTNNYLNYYFNKDEHLEGVQEELKNIQDNLGEKINTLDEFFKTKNSYNDDDLSALGISEQDLKDYADLDLGIKIRDCIIENGECNFDAEL